MVQGGSPRVVGHLHDFNRWQRIDTPNHEVKYWNSYPRGVDSLGLHRTPFAAPREGLEGGLGAGRGGCLGQGVGSPLRCYSHPAMIGRVSRPWAGGTRDQGASREGVDHGAPSPWLRPPSPQLSVPGSPHPGPAPRPAGHATPTTWWGAWGSLAA